MAWLAVDKDGSEYIYDIEPIRRTNGCYWATGYDKQDDPIGGCIELPIGSIKKLIGKELTWGDEPVEI